MENKTIYVGLRVNKDEKALVEIKAKANNSSSITNYLRELLGLSIEDKSQRKKDRLN